MRKPTICIGENKDSDQLHSNTKLISAFVFATRIVQPLFFSNPKFQDSSLLFETVQAGLCRTWSETQIVGFLKHRLKYENKEGGVVAGVESTYSYAALSIKKTCP